MADRPEGEYVTVIVRRIWTAATPDGATALVLDLDGLEPIAVVLNQRKIDLLRKHLADAEAFLAQSPGHS